ncbi:exo-alpha-sialidase [Verrucomicrobiaceae bacterium N1E253]|uniref:exo-alpha-sialidase n=1 Tax=Oceaniferula marina TaxID=2748318 RepID=A0A851GCV7_9BACT|nr:sialidase family protein [Oceaniferula marina]NWK54772.1 exo-alpha-sialidase [Oceaniferula marina]
MKITTLALTSLISLTALQLSAKTLYVVKDGKFTEHAHRQGNSWKESGQVAIGKNTGQRLAFRHKVQGNEFSVSTKLSLTKLNHTSAGIYMGTEFFGFDGQRGLFTEGGSFGGVSFYKGPELTAGEPFTFVASGKDGKISFSINGQHIVTKPYDQSFVRGIALRPHRGEMNIHEFKVSGTISELEKLNHLFACGTEGYKSYRIPALVTTTKGSLLAFCEGRKHGSGDHGDIDIVMKRSTDGGKTWSPLQVVHDNHNHVAGNPAPIIDQQSGRIHLLSCTSAHHEYAIYQGKGRRGIFIQHSDDDGQTWSSPRDIASNIYPENWRWYATGPCSGIQIREGKHAGRLVCPANHTYVEEGSDKNHFRAHCIFSDDHGKTWQLGGSSAFGGNESSIAEAGNDLLYQSIRMQSHRKGVRGTRYSRDGGETWTELKHDQNLPCPMCQGAVIRDYSQSKRLIHSNPGTRNGRNGMTIRISDDGGQSWPLAKTILNTSSAYSDISLTKDGDIAILFEGGHYAYSQEGIIFNIYPQKEIKEKPAGQK